MTKLIEDIFGIISYFFDSVYQILVLPLVYAIADLLNLLISPLSSYSPQIQIIVVAVFAGFLARFIDIRFKSKREEKLMQDFKDEIAKLKYTDDIKDKTLKMIFKKGINEAADEAYGYLIIDKLFDMGISYFFPLFFFLIWIEYSLFPPETLKALTGSKYAWVTKSGIELTAAWFFLYCFNFVFFTLWIIEAIYKFISKRLKPKKQKIDRKIGENA